MVVLEMNESRTCADSRMRKIGATPRRATLIGVVAVAVSSVSLACSPTQAPAEQPGKEVGSAIFTYSGVAEGRSKHYVVSPDGALLPQGGDPRKDAEVKENPATSASPSTVMGDPTLASEVKPGSVDPELRGDATPKGAKVNSGGSIEWKVLSTEDASKLPPSMLVQFRLLEDASDSTRLGFSYGMMEESVLVVALPEGVLLSWDKEKYKGKVSISKNGTEITQVPVDVGSYLDRDVTALTAYSYNITRTQKESGAWSSMSLDVAIPPAFDRKTLKNMVYLQASAISG